MGWDHRGYVDFIKKNAPATERAALLQASSRPFAPNGPPKRGSAPKIFVTYYSMPDWLDIFSSPPKSLASPKVRLDSRLGKAPFAQMIGEYRFAAKQHQDRVTALLQEIAKQPSGQALLAEVGGTGHTIRIMPYWHYFRTMPGGEYSNSTSIAVKPGEKADYIADGTVRDDVGAYDKGASIRTEEGEALPSFGKGTGKGADVLLFYSAEIWESKDAEKIPGFKPDEVLFHELVHITRTIRGRQTMVKVEGKGGFGNIEEYFATTITNIYLSDKGETRLRGFYSNDSIRPDRQPVKVDGEEIMVVTKELPKDWSVMKEPDKFYDNVDSLSIPPRQLMQTFKDKQADFYFSLAHLPEVKPKFNPAGRHFRESLRPALAPARRRP